MSPFPDRSSINAFSFDSVPVSSIIRQSFSTSTIFARKISASEIRSALSDAFARTLIITSSLHTELLSFNGFTSITSSILRTCFSICERICSSPLATIVILVNLGSAVVPAVILSILYPRLLNNPAIRLNSPGLL